MWLKGGCLFMKIIIITNIILTVCVALCAAVWPWSIADEMVPMDEKTLGLYRLPAKVSLLCVLEVLK
jgi:ABC-type lipoprotein release transport system permease subunit